MNYPVSPGITQGITMYTWRQGSGSGCCNESGGCALAMFCPCIAIARASQKIGIGKYSYLVPGVGIPFICCIVLRVFLLRFICFLIMGSIVYSRRKAMRKRLEIPGSETDDCFQSMCCSCCIISQMYAQVGLKGLDCGPPRTVDMDVVRAAAAASPGGQMGIRGNGNLVVVQPYIVMMENGAPMAIIQQPQPMMAAPPMNGGIMSAAPNQLSAQVPPNGWGTYAVPAPQAMPGGGMPNQNQKQIPVGLDIEVGNSHPREPATWATLEPNDKAAGMGSGAGAGAGVGSPHTVAGPKSL